jgi:hypothetical protein
LSALWFLVSAYPFVCFLLTSVLLSALWFPVSVYPFVCFLLTSVLLSALWFMVSREDNNTLANRKQTKGQTETRNQRADNNTLANRSLFSVGQCVVVFPLISGFCLSFCLFSVDQCFVYPMLPVSLDCPFLVAPLVFCNVYLHMLGKQFLLLITCYSYMYIQ